MNEELHRVVSLLIRDCTLVAKAHHDLARHYRALAQTYRLPLDDTLLSVLPSPSREKDVAVSEQPYLEFGSGSKKDFD
jgi:hypothetical protein